MLLACKQENIIMITFAELEAKNKLYMTSLEKRLENNPEDIQALLHKGIMLFASTYLEHDAGLAILLSIIAKNPSYVDAYLWLGEFYHFVNGDYHEATKYLKIALEIDPMRADCHALLAGALQEYPDIDPREVANHYRKSFELEPTFLNPRFYLAQYFFELERFSDARHEFEEMLKYLTNREWPTNNPVEEYYEDLITGRSRTNVKQLALDFIIKIDAAEAAVKIKPGE